MKRRKFLLGSAGGLAASMLGPYTSSAKLNSSEVSNSNAGIFPWPATISVRDGDFALTQGVSILVPREPSSQDLFLAQALRNDLADWFGVLVAIRKADQLDANQRAIVMGTMSNPLVRSALHNAGIASSERPPENYTLHVRPNLVIVAGTDARGALYGLQSLRQVLKKENDKLAFQGVDVQDHPSKPFRGLKLYLPGRMNIAFFKRFVRDFMAAYKFNTLIMELNAGMRLETHPELNVGWGELVEDTNFSRRNYPPGALHNREQNSSHQDTADGGFLEKRQVAEIADWVRAHDIELIPEMPSFTHSYYLLSPHKDLSEVPGDKWPDTYCPSDPRTYDLLFDVYDEYIDLLKPRMVHVGHDELFAPIGLCPRCKDRDIGERYGEDVARIHEHLEKKNIQMAMWGDMLLESVRGKGLRSKRAPDGWEYKVAGALTPDQVQRLVPKDILIFNWFWKKEEEWSEEQAENNEVLLDNMGFKQIIGNFAPVIANYEARSKRPTLLGGAPSAWFATDEFNFGKSMLSDLLGCSNILWNGRVMDQSDLLTLTQSRVPEIRARFRGALPPSATERDVAPVEISHSFNTRGSESELNLDIRNMRRGTMWLGKIRFDLTTRDGNTAAIVGTQGTTRTSLPSAVGGIAVGVDPTSLIFLHACAKPSANREPDRLIWDAPDSADLLGWYEIVYEDGFVDTIPIRYGVNIAEWNWAKRSPPRSYCYAADPVPLAASDSDQITLFSFEWPNPRLGKTIREVRLKGTSGFKGADPDFTNGFGPPISTNAVILKAISVVKKRSASASSRT